MNRLLLRRRAPRLPAASRAMRRKGTRERGIALLVVLLIITIVATLSIETQYLTRIDAQIAANVALDTQFYYLAKSGVEAARSLLSEDRRDNGSDATTETWGLPIAYPVDEALVSLDIVDEERKFPLNALYKAPTGQQQGQQQRTGQQPGQGQQGQEPEPTTDPALYEAFGRLLESVDASPEIAAAIVDWLDPDDDPYGPDGAEVNVYERLKPPYRPKNGPFSTLEELRMVRGFDAKVFVGIADKVTPYSTEGKININTVSRELLTVLVPELDGSRLDELIEKRIETPFTTNSEVATYIDGFKDVLPDVAAVKKLFRCDSSHFTIRSSASLVPSPDDEGTQAQNVKVLQAVVNRGNDGSTQLVYWRAS